MGINAIMCISVLAVTTGMLLHGTVQVLAVRDTVRVRPCVVLTTYSWRFLLSVMISERQTSWRDCYLIKPSFEDCQ